MREGFINQLETLHTELIRMGALCEDAIASAVKGLIDGDEALRDKVKRLEMEIDQKEREIEAVCIRLLIREQPVAGDLRQINGALKMIANMERIGDQAVDIAELAGFMKDSAVKSDVHIADMADAAVSMLKMSVDSFVLSDVLKAREVILRDDVIDELFIKIRSELIGRISRDNADGGACLDLLMIAKYLERIGDHAENIAEEVLYTITGERGNGA